MKAKLIKTDGTNVEVKPENGTDFTLEELYKHLECDIIEVVYMPNDQIMIIDEEGRLKENPKLNPEATRMYKRGYIFGHAIICNKDLLK
jgi:hypothetical protein